MLTDLSDMSSFVEDIGQESTQLLIVLALSQIVKNFLKKRNVDESWFPITAIGVGIFTQLILFLLSNGVTPQSLLMGLFYGTRFGLLSNGSYDNGKALNKLTGNSEQEQQLTDD